VLIPVTVLDRNDRSIMGLEKERFKLFEDKAEQVVTHFAMEEAPVAIGFVFDASASMREKLLESRQAIATVLTTANPDDEFFLVQFNDHVDLAVDLTGSTKEIEERLILVRPAGRTALLDAIHFSLRQIRHANNVRKALIIVSDGGDNCSRYTVGDLRNLMREADVQMYAIGIFGPAGLRWRTPEEATGADLLRNLAKQSGGHLFEVDSLRQLPDVASKIGDALRSQYLLGYSPNTTRDGKYHRVEVKLQQQKGSPKLQPSWRHGYYAPVE
jgi:VWFA-related protein